jgi:hypothetical protein
MSGAAVRNERQITWNINAIAGKAHSKPKKSDSRTEAMPSKAPAIKRTLGTRLLFTQKKRIRKYAAQAAINRGDSMISENCIAMKENAVHTTAASRRYFMEYLTFSRHFERSISHLGKGYNAKPHAPSCIHF